MACLAPHPFRVLSSDERFCSRRFEKFINQIELVTKPLHAACEAALARIDGVRAKLVEAEALIKGAEVSAQCIAFAAECNFFLTKAMPRGAPPQMPAGGGPALGALLINSPNLRSCLQVLGPAPVQPEHLDEVRYTLCSLLRGMQWPEAVEAAQADVEVLLQLSKAQPDLIDSDVVAAMLKNTTFSAPLDELTLRLLVHCCDVVETPRNAVNDAEELGASAATASVVSALPASTSPERGDATTARFPVHGPAATGLLAWLNRLTPMEWRQLPAWTNGEVRTIMDATPAIDIFRWASGLVSLKALGISERAPAIWVLDMLCRSLEDAQRGTDAIATLTALLATQGTSVGLYPIRGDLLRLILASCRRSVHSHATASFELLMGQLELEMKKEEQARDAPTAQQAADEEECAQPMHATADNAVATCGRLLPAAGELLALALATICPSGEVTMEAVMEMPRLWTTFFCWHEALVKDTPPVAHVVECADFADTRTKLADIDRSARRTIAAGAVLSACPMGRLRSYKAQLASLEPLFAAAGSSISKAKVVRALGDVDVASGRLRDVKRVALELLASFDSEILRCCAVLEGGWDSNSLEDAQAFLGIEPEDSEALVPLLLRLRSKGGRQHRLRPLPKALTAGLAWLLVACESKLFNRFWVDATSRARADIEAAESAQSGGSVHDVAPPTPRLQSSVDHEAAALEEEEWLCRAMRLVRRSWVLAYHGIVTQTTRLDELREYVNVLLRSRELIVLETTAAGMLHVASADGELDAHLESTEEWPLGPNDPEWQRHAAEQLSQLAHTCAVRAVLPRVQRCLVLFDAWVVAAEEPIDLVAVQSSAAELASVLDTWDAATLATLHGFSSLASKVDARLLVFEDRLFSAIQESHELMRWYRITPDEQNFTTSVEMAMGRSQMECPDALCALRSSNPLDQRSSPLLAEIPRARSPRVQLEP